MQLCSRRNFGQILICFESLHGEKGLHVLFRYTDRQGLDPQSDQDISFLLNEVNY